MSVTQPQTALQREARGMLRAVALQRTAIVEEVGHTRLYVEVEMGGEATLHADRSRQRPLQGMRGEGLAAATGLDTLLHSTAGGEIGREALVLVEGPMSAQRDTYIVQLLAD